MKVEEGFGFIIFREYTTLAENIEWLKVLS